MPDRRLYHEDPAAMRVETRIVEAGELDGRPWVRLEATPFYPEGGGQPADRGTIEGVAVVDVRSRGAEVLHFLERPLPAGVAAVAVLDADRRFDHSQQHTAQHALTALLLERHGRRTTAFHLGETYAAIEIAGNVPSEQTLRGWEIELNAEVRRDPPVRTRWVEPEAMAELPVRSRGLPDGHTGPVRLVEIEGLDLNTCGGTHVVHLGQLQLVHLLDATPARGGVRVRFLAGNRVFRRLHEMLALEAGLKARLGTGPEEFSQVLEKWQTERQRLARRVRELEAERAETLGAELAAEPGPHLGRFLPGAGPELLRAVAGAVLERRPEAVVALVGEDGDPPQGCLLVQAGPHGPEDVSEIGVRLRDRLGAKGGGRGRNFQGRGGRWPTGEPLFEPEP
ncbi:MAG: alanyl-tRNA editing protein [Deltaproteobacteria bacterium]|nr:alanyl-tRNA editing protein [Deltaproteobacteria bacterium]